MIKNDEPTSPASQQSVDEAMRLFVTSLTENQDTYVAFVLDGKPSDTQLMEIRTFVRTNTPQQLDALIGWLYNRQSSRWELGVINAVPTI